MLRYMQQALVDEVGIAGQQKLLAAKVLVIGAGGLGTPLSVYLASAGIGTLGIVDGDTISLSNLARQFSYGEGDIGALKATVLAQRLSAQNGAITVQDYPEMLSAGNAKELFSLFDIICDCTDNAATRILCDAVCKELQKPLVYAAVRDWQGYVAVLHHRRGISLSEAFDPTALLESEKGNCAIAGIINTTCGIAASLAGAEVLKIILGLDSELDGGILAFDSLRTVFRTFKLQGAK